MYTSRPCSNMEEMNGTPNPMPVNTNDPQMEAMVKDLETTIARMQEENFSLRAKIGNLQNDRAEMLNRTIDEHVRTVAQSVVEEQTDGRLWDSCEIESMIEDADFVTEYDFSDHVRDSLNYIDLSQYGLMTECDVEDGVADIISSMELVSRDDVEEFVHQHRDCGDVMDRELLDRVEALENLVSTLAEALRGWVP